MRTPQSSPFLVNLVYLRTLYSQSAASLTMSSLGGYLRSIGFSVKFNFIERGNHYSRMSIVEEADQPQVIIAKPNFKDHADLLPYLRQLKSQSVAQRIFLCGPFAQLNAQGILERHKWCDGVILGQPEATVAEILRSMSSDLQNWNMETGGTVLRDPASGDLIVNHQFLSPISLDELPHPARDIEREEQGAYINLEASRGCLYNCSFCHVPLASNSEDNHALNIRSPEKVVNEIQKINEQMGKTLFIFNDSCFWANSGDDERILRFCREIKNRDLDVRFYIYLRCKPFISEHVLDALVDAGLVRVFLGVENSVPRTQLLYKKPLQEDDFEQALNKLEDRSVDVHIGYITVEPHSSPEEVMDNINYLHKIDRLFRLGVILEPVRVVPGSALCNELKDSGLLKDGLPYDEITYGYDFEHPATGRFLGVVQHIFRKKYSEEAYLFEYFCTVTELLEVLLDREPQVTVSKLINLPKLHSIKREVENRLLEYFREIMAICRSTEFDDASKVAGQVDSNFPTFFRQETNRLEIEYWKLVSKLRKKGVDRPLDEIYHGLDRL